MKGQKSKLNRGLDLKVATLALATFSAAAYVTCVAYGVVASNPQHHKLFELLPGVRWLDATSFLIGLADMFVIGAFYGALFVLIYNYFVRKYAKPRR